MVHYNTHQMTFNFFLSANIGMFALTDRGKNGC